MTELVTAAQMRAIEQAAIESGDVTGLELMERAGQGVVEAIFEEWPELDTEVPDAPAASGEGGAAPAAQGRPPRDISGPKKQRAVVLCGPGNNGGDGFVVARLLKAKGWEVSVWELAAPGEGAPDAAICRQAWLEAGGAISTWDEIEPLGAPDLLVDAVFGTGLTRPIPVALANMFRLFRDRWHAEANWDDRIMRQVAVDIPSGLSSDTGWALRPDEDPRENLPDGWPDFMDWVFPTDLTVTFHNAKLGHFLRAGGTLSRKLRIKPLHGLGVFDASGGLPVSVEGHVRLIEPVFHGREVPGYLHFSFLEKHLGHKFDHGHALVMSGPPGQGGAARLAARGALRIGAGLVTVGCPLRAVTEHAVQLTAIMVKGLDGTHGLGEILEDKRITGLCLGPGLGLGPATADLVRIALEAKRGTVLDADALSRFQRKPDVLFDMLHDNCVLTPHGGEFARLFPDLAERLDAQENTGTYSKVDATREAAKRAGCVVLFKGADTVIAAPDGRCSINAAVGERAVPWLATAGAGDVLAGMITGLLARGFDAMSAAETVAWLHVEAARSFGPGLIAEDLPEELPKVFRALGL
ncbi:NAD(P)H-hydrate dehydratase [Tropicibacter sp. R15_0]|uniref:NAD(P)H-hydrate dehydratase n=1 Tax=Tropicibacter sp. R15_0 TaxID=2821101 RepID=UPI001AD95321|nr:NAD(P)H-hydrate dehydratase [Tropicibacter sp. R15_0]MBO9466729.1 NAD(P)H-hydrate dehydratase [Tropicibacter sp. R15_0]